MGWNVQPNSQNGKILLNAAYRKTAQQCLTITCLIKVYSSS